MKTDVNGTDVRGVEDQLGDERLEDAANSLSHRQPSVSRGTNANVHHNEHLCWTDSIHRHENSIFYAVIEDVVGHSPNT